MAKKKVSKNAPQKQCPKCNAMVHARRGTCDCGYKFTTTPKKKAAPKKKKAAQPKPKATSLPDALKAERATLQQRIDKIDDLLNDYN